MNTCNCVCACDGCVFRARTKAFPATAQVASQQGEYLARRLNGLSRLPSDAEDAPFNFRNLGQLAYIGGEKAALDLGGGHNISGWGQCRPAHYSAASASAHGDCRCPLLTRSQLSAHSQSLPHYRLPALWYVFSYQAPTGCGRVCTLALPSVLVRAHCCCPTG